MGQDAGGAKGLSWRERAGAVSLQTPALRQAHAASRREVDGQDEPGCRGREGDGGPQVGTLGEAGGPGWRWRSARCRASWGTGSGTGQRKSPSYA